jgi:hypothetical protein
MFEREAAGSSDAPASCERAQAIGDDEDREAPRLLMSTFGGRRRLVALPHSDPGDFVTSVDAGVISVASHAVSVDPRRKWAKRLPRCSSYSVGRPPNRQS